MGSVAQAELNCTERFHSVFGYLDEKNQVNICNVIKQQIRVTWANMNFSAQRHFPLPAEVITCSSLLMSSRKPAAAAVAAAAAFVRQHLKQLHLKCFLCPCGLQLWIKQKCISIKVFFISCSVVITHLVLCTHANMHLSANVSKG